MRSSIHLGKLFGIPIGLNPSWFIAFGLIVVLLGTYIFPAVFPDMARGVAWLLALIGGGLFFASVIMHELAHSLVARRFGIPVKGITLFIFGGVAQLAQEATRPRAEFLMAAAGPGTSLLLAGLFVLMWLALGSGDEPLAVLFQWLWIMNLGVGLFNLAPGFPMDGGRLLRACLWGITGDFQAATRWAAGIGQGISYTLIALGVLVVFPFSWWPWDGSPWNGLWLILIGMFLNNAARQSYAQTQMLNELRRHRISDIMDRTLPLADANATTAEGLRMVSTGNSALHVARGDLRRPIFVADDERVVGAVTAWDMYRVDEARRDSVTLREIMTETRKVPFVDASADAATVLQRMEADEVSHMPVVEDGRLVGIVSRDELVKLLGRRQFLQR